MPRVIRIDRSGAELRPARKTSQGALRVDGMATRAGVLEYPQPDGSVRRELRPPEEVFSQAHLDSFLGAPVTDGHPPAMVTVQNRRQYDAGTVLSPGERADGDYVKVSFDAADPVLQGKMSAKKKLELSPGYTVDLDETPGVHPQYGRYDAIQRNIEVNHLAVVERARAGHGARVRMDAQDMPVGDPAGTMPCPACGAAAMPGEPCPACGEMVPAMKMDAELDAQARANLRDTSFAVPDRSGLPIEDEGHLQAAMARFGQYRFADAAEKKAAYGRILRRAKVLGVDSSGFEKAWGDRLDGHGACMPAGTGYATGMPEGKDHTEALAAATAEIAREKTRADALEAQLASEKERADTAAGQVIALTARLGDVEQTRVDADELQALKDKVASLEASLETERKARTDAESPATRQAAITRRVKIEMAARQFLDASARFDGMDDRALMEMVCQKLRGVKFDAKDAEATVAATFSLLVEDAQKHADANRRIREIVNANRSERVDTIETAREKRERETTEAWKKPLPSSLIAKDK